MSEHLDRLRMMAEGNPKWDLSPNDRKAIAAGVDALAREEAAGKAEPCAVAINEVGEPWPLVLYEVHADTPAELALRLRATAAALEAPVTLRTEAGE